MCSISRRLNTYPTYEFLFERMLMETLETTQSDQFTITEMNLEDYIKCALCGQELKFVQKIDYLNSVVHEDAHCLCCKVKLKTRKYSLQ